MFAGTRSRRELDRTQRRAAANRRIGHDMAYWYAVETPVKVVVWALVLGAGGWFLWTRVDHAKIAGVTGAVGLALLLGYLAWWASVSSSYARTMRLAQGKTRPFAMHFIGAAGALLVAGAITMWATGS